MNMTKLMEINQLQNVNFGCNMMKQECIITSLSISRFTGDWVFLH